MESHSPLTRGKHTVSESARRYDVRLFCFFLLNTWATLGKFIKLCWPGGQHQLNSSIPTYIPGADEQGSKHRTEFNPENFQTDIAKRLVADGYKVGESRADAVFTDSDGTIVCSYEYLVVAVHYNGQWLVAEDLLLSFNSDYAEPETEPEVEEEPTQTVVEIDRDAVIYTASEFYSNVFDGNLESENHLKTNNELFTVL